MASFFLNLIRGEPISPSQPSGSSSSSGPGSSAEPIADYCGTFDAASGKWGNQSSEEIFHHHHHLKEVDASIYTPYYDTSDRRRTQNGFMEQHVRISELDTQYQEYKKNTNSVAVGSSSSSSSAAEKKNTRIVFFSDSHQYHHKIKLPMGDILVCGGDNLLSDRYNASLISEYYVNDFLRWFKSQPHRHKVICCGNHDHFFEMLGEAELKKRCAPAIFLTGEEIVDIEGIRFFGNSYSFGASKNSAFQNQMMLRRLQNVPFDRVVDGARRKDVADDDDDDERRLRQGGAVSTSSSVTSRSNDDGDDDAHDGDNREGKKSGTSSTTLLLPKRPNHSAVDILLTHSILPPSHNHVVDTIIAPCVHLVGHDHDAHGLSQRLRRRSVQRFPTRDGLLTKLYNTAANSTSYTSDGDGGGDHSKVMMSVQDVIPEVNGAIVADYQKWNPVLQPPVVLDFLPL